MKKRALSLLFASVAAAACLSCGCGGESNGSIIILDDGNQTQAKALTVYGHKTDRYSFGVIENVLQSFMSSNSGVNVSYESAAKPEYWQALDKRCDTDNLDDVFMIDSGRLAVMTANGQLADLSDAVNADIFDEIALSQLYSADGGIYAVPTGVSIYGLYVNYGLLEQNGQQVPRNLSEFTAVCNYFVSNGITPVLCNGGSPFRSLILARGMYDAYCTEDTAKKIEKFNANPVTLSQPLSDGIDFVYQMIENGWLKFTGHTDDLQQFATGQYPFMINEGQASADLKEIISDSGKSISYGVHAYPVLNSGSVLAAQADSLISVKKGANENEAKKLVSELSDFETIFNLNYGQNCFSPLKQTPFNADSAIIPSASYLTKGKYVLISDINIKIPLDGILSELSALIIGGESNPAVKSHLLNLLEEVGR